MITEDGGKSFESGAIAAAYLKIGGTPRMLEEHHAAGTTQTLARQASLTHRDIRAIAVRWGIMPTWPRSSAGGGQ